MNCLRADIRKAQDYILECIEMELKKEHQSSIFNAVWFYPKIGAFLYADFPVTHEVIYPLIENKTLVYKGVERHQDELMPKYVLNERT